MLLSAAFMMFIQKLLDPRTLEMVMGYLNIFRFFTSGREKSEDCVKFETVQIKVEHGYTYAEGCQSIKIIDNIFKYLRYLGVDLKDCKLLGFKNKCFYKPTSEIKFRDFLFVSSMYYASDNSKIITTLNIYGDSKKIRDFVDESLDFCNKKQNNSTSIKVYKILPAKDKLIFSKTVFESMQTFENLFMPGLKNYIESIDKFLSGKLSKVSFLLHGEPGCGKTSFIKSIINYVKMPVMDLKLKDVKTSDDLDAVFFEKWIRRYFPGQNKTVSVGKRIVIMEDIDADDDMVFRRTAEKPVKREEISILKKKDDALYQSLDKEDKKPTLSNLLNVLDGVVEFRGIIIMTTNHVEKLDPALVRPGRITHNIRLKKIQEPEIGEMTAHYFGQPVKVPEGKYTPAELDNMCKTASTPVDLLNKF